jgi:hypothetical protein
MRKGEIHFAALLKGSLRHLHFSYFSHFCYQILHKKQCKEAKGCSGSRLKIPAQMLQPVCFPRSPQGPRAHMRIPPKYPYQLEYLHIPAEAQPTPAPTAPNLYLPSCPAPHLGQISGLANTHSNGAASVLPRRSALTKDTELHLPTEPLTHPSQTSGLIPAQMLQPESFPRGPQKPRAKEIQSNQGHRKPALTRGTGRPS